MTSAPEQARKPYDELAAWLLEQVAEDERIATEAAAAANEDCYIKDPPGPTWDAGGGSIFGGPTMQRGVTEQVPLWGCSCSCLQEASDEVALHVAEHDPGRVLAECNAKRRLVELHSLGTDPCDAHGPDLRSVPCEVLTLLALPFADRPGYREEWRP